MYPRGYVTRLVHAGTDLESSQRILNLLHQIPTRPSDKCAEAAKKLENYKYSQHKDIIDLRQQLVITIDPEGCRDVDDALSIRRLKTGDFVVGVHIADVGRFDL